MSSPSANLLQRQLKELRKSPVPGFEVDLRDDDNIYKWDVAIIGAPDTIYEGGYFQATMEFTTNYPFDPPTFKFNRAFYHPNVYDDGRLCISILHPPGDDPVSGEKAEERWNPTQSVESVLISIISLLADPNCSSPANVDAGVNYRNDRTLFNKIVKRQVDISKQDIPEGYKMPENFNVVTNREIEDENSDFWHESDDGSNFDDESEEDEEDDEH